MKVFSYTVPKDLNSNVRFDVVRSPCSDEVIIRGSITLTKAIASDPYISEEAYLSIIKKIKDDLDNIIDHADRYRRLNDE